MTSFMQTTISSKKHVRFSKFKIYIIGVCSLPRGEREGEQEGVQEGVHSSPEGTDLQQYR